MRQGGVTECHTLETDPPSPPTFSRIDTPRNISFVLYYRDGVFEY